MTCSHFKQALRHLDRDRETQLISPQSPTLPLHPPVALQTELFIVKYRALESRYQEAVGENTRLRKYFRELAEVQVGTNEEQSDRAGG